jgi:hypothetical protein
MNYNDILINFIPIFLYFYILKKYIFFNILKFMNLFLYVFFEKKINS